MGEESIPREEKLVLRVHRKNVMKIQSLRTLRGPNVWSDSPGIEALLLAAPGGWDSEPARNVALLATTLQEAAGIVAPGRTRTSRGSNDGEYREIGRAHV